MSIWEKFDNSIDTQGLQHDIEEAAKDGGTGDYPEVPLGTYECKIEKLEMKESKKHSPMVTCWFKILEGEYKGSMIFMNQVITQGFQIHIVNEFLRSLDSGVNIKFTSYSQYNDLLMDVFEEIGDKLEYAIKYGETNKGFKTFKVEDVFEKE